MAREYIPNAWLSLGKTYHVAQCSPNASDANPGTEALPFETISAAAAVACKYDRVVIGEGVYREQVPLPRDGDRNLPSSWIVYEGAPDAKVYLKASDPFDPDWERIEPGVHRAALPESLFQAGAYNPYELPCEPGPRPVNYEFDRGGYDPGNPATDSAKVRPASGPTLAETLGQIYVDGGALHQLDGLDAVRETPGSFVVSADGKQIICHFVGGEAPKDKLLELTVRERCFKPEFTPHWAGLIIRTLGIVVEHAADPGAFCSCRPLSIRRNRRSGTTVRKTFNVPCSVPGAYVLQSNLSYLSADGPAIVSSAVDATTPTPPDQVPTTAVVSHDGARTWERVESGPLANPVANYFLDEENGMLIRHFRRRGDGTVYNDKAVEQHASQKLVMQASADAGKTWGAPEELDFGDDIVCFTLMKLRSGELFWIIEENKPELSALAGLKPDAIFFVCRAWLGTWRPDLSGIDWERGGLAQAPPEMGSQGVGEPQACQLDDGRIFIILRQGVVLPSQHAPGYPSVKLFCISDDDGRMWSDAKPLTFDDGKYVYSSTGFSSCFRSPRNGRVYVILNILNGPNEGCLPRNVLHIAELDPDTLSVMRDTVAIIDEVDEEHTHLSGYSNWQMLPDRYTKNMLLFMKMESGPVFDGYDWSCYRYEIELPG